jgi:hypothetical protein
MDPTKRFSFDHLPRTERPATPAPSTTRNAEPEVAIQQPILYTGASQPETSREARDEVDTEQLSNAARVLHALLAEREMAEFELRPLFDETYTTPHVDNLHQEVRNVLRDQGLVRPVWLVRDHDTQRKNPKTKRWQQVYQVCRTPPPRIIQCDKCHTVLGREYFNEAGESLGDDIEQKT